MKIGPFDTDVRPMVIAEIGANHEGDPEVAKAMVWEAARAGADVVKFQTYRAEKIVARSEATRFTHFQRLALTADTFVELAAIARDAGVVFLSTPFDLDTADALDPLMPAFKIASGDLTFLPLLERVGRSGKPILLSTGMATFEEIDGALEVVSRAAGVERAALSDRVILMHCVSNYPTAPEDANLRRMTALQAEFHLPVGYSDHTLGITACLGAVALGACVLEKHFTLEKHGRTFRDHQLSADPADLRDLTAQVRSMAAMLGPPTPGGEQGQDASRIAMRRSLAARVDIKAGAVIEAANIVCLRPGTGLPPSSIGKVIGRVALEDVAAGHLIPPSAVGL